MGGWLLALGLRSRLAMPKDAGRFNLIQVGLAMWTLLALLLIVISIQHGLLGRPDMLVQGNQSSSTVLNWYQDRSAGPFPQAWIVSLPLLAYRLVMLAVETLPWGDSSRAEITSLVVFLARIECTSGMERAVRLNCHRARSLFTVRFSKPCVSCRASSVVAPSNNSQ